MKKITALLILVAMVFACTGCGSSLLNDIKGDWTLFTVNGQPLSEFAEINDMAEADIALSLTVSDDSVTFTNSTISATYDIELRNNGFDIIQGAKLWTVIYDDKESTLSYSVESIGEDSMRYDYVLTRATSDKDSAKE